MASRVNIKFMIALSAVVVVACTAVVFGAYKILTRSGDNFIALGDRAVEEGDFLLASQMYGRAVGHDQTRIDWMEKWFDALTQSIPPTTPEYDKAYHEFYMGILSRIAALRDTDPGAQLRYLDAEYRRTFWLRNNARGWEDLTNQVTTRMTRLNPEQNPDAKRLLRYRGLAGLAQMRQFEPSESVRARTLSDLREAFAADPTDIEVASSIPHWYMIEWRRALRARRTDLAAELHEELHAQLDALVRRFPNELEARLTHLQLRATQAVVLANTVAGRRLAVREFHGEETELVDVALASDPARITGIMIERLGQVLLTIRPNTGHDLVIPVIDHALTAQPHNEHLLLMKGISKIGAKEFRDAIETLQQGIDLPDAPVSLEGILRRELQLRALSLQGESALGIWERETDAESRAMWMERAKAYRSALVARARGGESSPQALMLDARIALAEERFQAATRAIEQYNRAAPGDEGEVLRLLTRALIGENQFGAALRQVERLLTLEPDNTQALLLAAEIDRRLLEPERAIQRIRQYLLLEPDNEPLREALTKLQMQIGIAPEGDVVAGKIIEARRMAAADPLDRQGVLDALLRSREEHPDDVRLVLALIEEHLAMNQVDPALALLDVAQTMDPDNLQIERVRRRLTTDDPVALALELIDESDAQPAERLVRKYTVLAAAGRADEAEDALRQATAIAPDNRHVLEIEFTRALHRREFDRAQAILSRAAATNADEAGGQLFEALLLQARGDDAGAIALLNRVLETLPYSTRALQLLGGSQLRLGRIDNAVQSLQRAYESQPDNVRAAQTLISALLQLNRNAEALRIARRNAELNPNSAAANMLRLDLEELAGDKAFAIEQRERLLRNAPANIENRVALIRLHTSMQRWDQARALIDSTLEHTGPTLPLAMIEATWLGKQGRVDAGRQLLADYIATLDADSMTSEPHLTLAAYLVEFDRAEEAIAAMEAARRHQSPTNMEADLQLGDFSFGRGDYASAAEAYARVVDADAGSDATAIRKRLAETYTRMSEWDQAAQTLRELLQAPGADSDVELLLLRAEIATGRGQTREGQRLLDEAVRAAPNNPAPFLRRAQVTMRNPDQFNDAIADIDQALRLQPSSIAARRMKAGLLMSRGRTAEAIAELRRAVDANPDVEELRLMLISQLVSTRAWADAMLVADDALRRSEGATNWLVVAGDTYLAASGAPENARDADRLRRTAASHIKKAYEDNGSMVLAVRLLNILLATSPPEANEALRVLNSLGEVADSEPLLLLLRSRTLRALGQTDQMESAARRAYSLIEDPDQLRLWFIEVGRLYPTVQEAARFASSMTPRAETAALHNVQLVSLQAGDVGQRSELIARLRELEVEASEGVRVDIYRIRSALEYQSQQYEDAARSLAAGRRILPEDREFNNNLAYVLAKHLDRPQEALAPAETAAQLAPNDPSVLDTLGWIYFRLDRIAQAEATLQRAVNLATSPDQAAPANLHMAQVMLAKEEFRAARRFAERAQEALRRSPGVAQEYGADLESLIQRLNQAEETR